MDSYLFDSGLFSNLYATSTKKDSCITEDSTLFLQYTCIQSEEDLATKYDQMAIAVATGVLICLLFTVSIKRMYEGGKIQQLEWDMATVTAGDYAVEFPIKSNDSSCGYDWWKTNVYRAPGGPFEQGIAPAFALKEYMKKEIE